MAKRTAEKREDRRDSAPRQEDSIFSSRERKLATASPSGGGRDACATTTFERPDLLILFGLAIVTFGIYAQVIGHRFITFDDLSYIKDNPMVNRGVTPAGLAWAFTTFHVGYWHPLTWIAHMIDSQLFGMFAGGHLLVNALFHVANTLLVFWFLLRTTHARWPSALVAALFALHPLHVESVAWAANSRWAFHIFRLAVADRLCALHGGAFHSAVHIGRHLACAGVIGQTNAGDVAFRHVAARLLAVAQICSHGRDIALRCQDAAARRPYLC